MSDILLPSPVSYGQIQDNAQIAQVINATRDPNANDKYAVGITYWANVTSGTAWQLVSYSAGVPQWVNLGGATSAVSTINGLSPTAGNIVIAGTANQISVASVGSTITLSVPSAFTAPASITAAAGAITATNGNIVLGTAGNKLNSTSVASTTTAGANSFGTVALSAGAATVNTTAVTANSIIFLTVQALGTVTAPSSVAVTAKVASTSFTITASQNTDTSTVAWFIVN